MVLDKKSDILLVVLFHRLCRNKRWVRWETKWSFDCELYREYLYQKLSKSDNWFSSYSRKHWGCFS